jgi:ALTTAQ repeat
MATTRHLRQSFSGGEISNGLLGQVSNEKVQTAASIMRNFIALPHGPATARPGFEYVASVRSPTNPVRLIPFVYSISNALVLEIGQTWIRMHENGGTVTYDNPPAWVSRKPYDAGDIVQNGLYAWRCCVPHASVTFPGNMTCTVLGPNYLWPYWSQMSGTNTGGFFEILYPQPWNGLNLSLLRYAQSNDVLTFTHPKTCPYVLTRYGATNWTLAPVSFDPSASGLQTPTGLTVTPTPSSVPSGDLSYKYTYAVSSLTSDLSVETPICAPVTVDCNLFVSGSENTLAWGVGSSTNIMSAYTTDMIQTLTTDQISALSTAQIQALSSVQIPVITTSGIQALTTTHHFHYFTTAQIPSLTTAQLSVVPTYDFVLLSSSQLTALNVSQLYSLSAQLSALSTTQVSVLQTFQDMSGGFSQLGSRYNIYLRTTSTGLFGFIGQTEDTTFVDDGIAPDLSITPRMFEPSFANGTASLAALSTFYPTAVCYNQGRKWFGGSVTEPNGLWATRSSTEADMSYSIPSNASDAIWVDINAMTADYVRHLVPVVLMIIFTGSAEWKIASYDGNAINQANISASPQTYIGSNDMRPVVVNYNVLYGAARGGHVRELSYNWMFNGYITGDISLYAHHLFDGYDVVDSAYMKSPFPLIWFVSSNGNLLGLTYVPEQKIAAWHHHDTTNGVFEAIACIPEGVQDTLYAVVKRTMNGLTYRYIERMAPLVWSNYKSSVFVDSALTYSGGSSPPTIHTISGLSYIADQVVSVYADGAVYTKTVSPSGTITIPAAAYTTVTVGLPITADLLTIPFAQQVDPAMGQGIPKNINKAWMRVQASGGGSIQVGPDVYHLRSFTLQTPPDPGIVPATGIYPSLSPGTLDVTEFQLTLTQSWNSEGQIWIRNTNPIPLTIVSIATEVSIGG